MNRCDFCCQESNGAIRDPWNEPIIETANFVALPSLGALVEGWSLLVPKSHFISFGAMPVHLRREADDLQKMVEDRLRARFGAPLTRFEHGPSASRHGTGCGVDHAHLHILPGHFNLLESSRSFMPADAHWTTGGWNERSIAFQACLDYLFLEEDGHELALAVANDFGSQVFRRAIASQIGIPDEYNWRQYPRQERAVLTGNLLRGLEECEYVA